MYWIPAATRSLEHMFFKKRVARNRLNQQPNSYLPSGISIQTHRMLSILINIAQPNPDLPELKIYGFTVIIIIIITTVIIIFVITIITKM